MNLVEEFEKLAALNNDAIAFEKLKNEIVEKFIEDFPEDKKKIFKAKLWRIEMDMRKLKNQQVRCNKALEMMWLAFLKLNNQLKKVTGENDAIR